MSRCLQFRPAAAATKPPPEEVPFDREWRESIIGLNEAHKHHGSMSTVTVATVYPLSKYGMASRTDQECHQQYTHQPVTGRQLHPEPTLVLGLMFDGQRKRLAERLADKRQAVAHASD